jgi:hypothetical protein
MGICKVSKQDYNEIFGTPGHGDYSPGDPITFIEKGQTLTGKVIHCSAPRKAPVSGRRLPLSYEVDAGDGWPHIVTHDQIVQR